MPKTTQQTWVQFLNDLEQGVARLAERVRAGARDAVRFGEPVVTRPSASIAESDEILIGVGVQAEKDEPSGSRAVPHQGICLNNKGAHIALGRPDRFPTVTDLVLSDGPSFWDGWRAIIGQNPTPGKIFDRFRLVVEDVSPDSCFGLVCFLARLTGIPSDQVPEPWVDYIRRWEEGDVISGEPREAYGPLHNALAHSFLQDDWGGAWVECLRFLLGALRSGRAPEDLGRTADWPEFLRARSMLDFEYQTYEDSLKSANLLHLRMPVTGAQERFRAVDAFVSRESVPLGSLKVFARNDREHTAFKKGFTLLALYKPGAEGSGNDMTVSVTPGAGVDLEDLWHELERMEHEAWDGKRPHDAPRLDIPGYPDGTTSTGGPAPNEPWFHTCDYSLLAAPRRLGKDGPMGSRLTWDDLTEAIWRTYNPFRNLLVRAENGASMRLDQCPAEKFPDRRVRRARRILKLAHWKPGEKIGAGATDIGMLRSTPTLERYLAASLEHPDVDRIRVRNLPEAEHYEFLELVGGFAVLSGHGMYVIDDWRREPLDITGIRREFENACTRLSVVQDTANEVQKFFDEIDQHLKQGLHRKSPIEVLNRLTGLKLSLGRSWTQTMPQTFDPSVRRLREALDARWGISGRLEELYRSVEQVSTLLDSYVNLRTNRRVAFLTLYGFPLALAAGFFGFLFDGIDPSLKDGLFDWDSIHWPGLVLFLLLAGAGILAVRVVSSLEDRFSRIQRPSDDD